MTDPRTFPLRLAPGIQLIAAVAALAGCQQPEPQDNAQDAVDEPVLNLPSVPRLEPLDRAKLLAAVAQAASAHASGIDDGTAQQTLDGRQFELRIRFGCSGPSSELREEWLGWTYDRQAGTLRVRAKPTLAAEDELVRAVGGDDFEAVEGFWIPRPWLLQPTCPAAAVRSEPAEVAAEAAAEAQPAEAVSSSAAADSEISEPVPKWPRVGIAQFFSDTDPRTGRRSMRPYEAVKKRDSQLPVGSQGFNLVLSGRLKALPGKRVIACPAKGPDSPPECVVSADFDRVWIETPGTRDVIAEWGGG